MPDLRKDPIVGRWVIVAKSRAKRPHDFISQPTLHAGRFCPFCEGNEDKTPGEVLAYRNNGAANGKGWRVRVVPNKFPALEIEGELNKRGDGIYDMMRGVGAHEVIIESPDHVLSTSDLSEKQLREVFWAYRDRLLDLKRDRRLVYGMLFKNVGAAAGASLEHTHSQLIVTPIVPVSVREEITGAQGFYSYRGRCVFCDMVHQELSSEKRIVLDTPGFLAVCPFASRFPFETWVLPKQHASHYENIQKPAVDELARVMRQVIKRIELAVDRPAYNYIVHTSPFDSAELPHYHWHIEIIPRLTNTAGFEWGTGFYINPVPPEDAAAFLREVEEPSPEPLVTAVAQNGQGAVESADRVTRP
jgi:UDPglucose--hexose-1-phosphate uridylyltransferase